MDGNEARIAWCAHSTPFFMTHHAPQGAWASLTFGLPGQGAGIEHENLRVNIAADLLVAVSRPGGVVALPFLCGLTDTDYEGKVAGVTSGQIRRRWNFARPEDVRRILTAGADAFSTPGLSFRVVSPRVRLGDPEHESIDPLAVCPGLLLELEVDNTDGDADAFGFVGLSYRGDGRICPLDWTPGGEFAGVHFAGRWALAARRVPGEVWTIRDNAIGAHVAQGRAVVHNGGGEGGVCLRVPARARRTLRAAFGFYHPGTATQGIAGRYAYTQHFADVEAVCRCVIGQADRLVAASATFDGEVASGCGDVVRRELFAQASQAYYANAQLLATDAGLLYSVCEGQFAWRNTLDLMADHVPFEAWRHPWVIRNMMDLHISRYGYRDRLRFPGQSDVTHPGGLSFAHDQGNYTAYSPPGQGGYEMAGQRGCYSFMTTEQLLNGIFCIAAYVLAGHDAAWLCARRTVLGDLLASMEARDHTDPAQRTGILRAETDRTGPEGCEITTYDALDESLKQAGGNVYMAVKTFAAAILLERVLADAGDANGAARAATMATRTAASLVHAFDEARGCFPPNLLAGGSALVMAAVEPLAVPCWLGLVARLRSETELVARLRRHALSCLATGACVDAASGALRLSSGSTNTWPSKTFICVYVMEQLLDIDLRAEKPSVLEQLARWLRVSAAETTVADQIESDTGKVKGAVYYPRSVSSTLLVRPRV